jgi:hypothetical protein
MEKRRPAKDEFLHSASSYLRIPKDGSIPLKGNVHSYCKVPHDFDEKEATRKPSFLKKIYHTLF